MNILVIGGTRFFGIHMVNRLLSDGHAVTIATRGNTGDPFGGMVNRITVDRTDLQDMREKFRGMHFDAVIDKVAYSSNDVKSAMEAIICDQYIYTSSAAIYQPKHKDLGEDDFDGSAGNLVWCSRADFSYAEVKRQAEYALWQEYSHRNWIAVRYPVVLGEDDYTKRLSFYVEHVVNSIPMNIGNLDQQMCYIRSEEAGEFMAFLAGKGFRGAVNGCSQGSISPGEVIAYVERKTGRKAILTAGGEDAPYNGEAEYTLNTDRARELGFRFTNLNDWIFDLLDYYIMRLK